MKDISQLSKEETINAITAIMEEADPLISCLSCGGSLSKDIKRCPFCGRVVNNHMKIAKLDGKFSDRANDSLQNEKFINDSLKKLVFIGLLFSMFLVLLAYLFASSSTIFSEDLPKVISLLLLGIFGMIAYIGNRLDKKK